MGEWDNEGDLWNCPQLAACGNDNTQQWWKWVWKHGGDAESVAKKGVARCLPSKVLQHQSAITPECYDTRVPPVHQSGATSMTLFWWHTEAWVAVGGTQKVFEKKWKWWFWRNTNGDSGEIQTPEARGIRVRLGGNGGRGGKLNIIEWEIYLGTPARQKVPDNYFFPLRRFVFPSLRKNEA